MGSLGFKLVITYIDDSTEEFTIQDYLLHEAVLTMRPLERYGKKTHIPLVQIKKWTSEDR